MRWEFWYLFTMSGLGLVSVPSYFRRLLNPKVETWESASKVTASSMVFIGFHWFVLYRLWSDLDPIPWEMTYLIITTAVSTLLQPMRMYRLMNPFDHTETTALFKVTGVLAYALFNILIYVRLLGYF